MAGATLLESAKPLRPGILEGLGRSLWVFVAIVLAAMAMHWGAPHVFSDFGRKLLMDVGIYIVLAVSLNIVNGFTGQFSIGHAGFMTVGGYVAGAVTYYASFRLWGSADLRPGLAGNALFVGACLAGGVASAIAGYVVGLPSLRLRGDYLAIVTLGFGEILRVLLQRSDDVLFFEDEVKNASFSTMAKSLGGALGFTGIPTYTSQFWVWLVVGIILVFSVRLKESTTGRAFLSIRENEVAAEASGVPTTRLKVRAFVLSSFFAGIGGALLAHQTGLINAGEMSFMKSFDLIIMVVLGGMGSISGVVLSAILLTLLPEWLRSFEKYRMIMYALILIIMMLVRPQGLFGIHEIWELPWIRRWLPGRKRTPPADAQGAA